MQITLNVLLYRLASNSNYETQNLSLSETFNAVKLFDMNSMVSAIEDSYKNIYIVTPEQLLENADKLHAFQLHKNHTFFCVCSDATCHINDFDSTLSLVLLYTEHSFVEIFNQLLNIFHDFDIWDKNLHLALLRNSSMQELLDLSSNILSHPMVVLDSNFSLLGYYETPDCHDPIMESILNSGYVTPQVMTKLRQDRLLSTSENAENPMINYYCLTTHDCYYSMMYRFMSNNQVAGYALIFQNRIHPKTNYLYLMNMVAENLELFFQQKRYMNRFSLENYELLLTDIIENPGISQTQFADQLTFIPGLTMNDCFMLAKITYTNMSELPYSFLSWNLRNSFSSLKPFVYENQLYILKTNVKLDRNHHFFNQEEEVTFRNLFRNHDFTCGISNVFFTLMDLPIAVKQSNEVFKLAPTSTNSFLYFEDVTLRYLLDKLKKDSFELIKSPQYYLLKQYDEENNSNLCEIFIEYLKNGRNINHTSIAIYMHRNTVLNKIKKALSIMHSDCDDHQSQITFILSYLHDHT